MGQAGNAKPELEADEIEITDEMLEAGASQLLTWDCEVEPPQAAALSVFQAMLAARRRQEHLLESHAPA